MSPASESCGTCVGVEPAEVDLTGMGMGRPAPWVGEECAEPAACACTGDTRHTVSKFLTFFFFFFGSKSKNNSGKKKKEQA